MKPAVVEERFVGYIRNTHRQMFDVGLYHGSLPACRKNKVYDIFFFVIFNPPDRCYGFANPVIASILPGHLAYEVNNDGELCMEFLRRIIDRCNGKLHYVL